MKIKILCYIEEEDFEDFKTFLKDKGYIISNKKGKINNESAE